MITKKPRPKKCKNPACGDKFVPAVSFQSWCKPDCAVVIARARQEKSRKALAEIGRKELRAAKERLKPKGQYMREAQAAFNAWIRARDAARPCISCGRHHEGQYHAGHYRTVGANPELRFEPANVHKQCAPCNNHKSGDIVNYRINLVYRIGQAQVDWLEGPHEPQRYTIDDLKAIRAKYKAMTKAMQGEGATTHSASRAHAFGG